DADNWSCAYDSFLTILWNTFVDARIRHLHLPDNIFSTDIWHSFSAVSDGELSLEYVRDHLRDCLSCSSPVRFPRFGHILTAVTDIAECLLHYSQPIGSQSSCCTSC
ncbi:hypothetical protein BKA93DRAFT_715020, partial [Sparassis latifolia]